MVVEIVSEKITLNVEPNAEWDVQFNKENQVSIRYKNISYYTSQSEIFHECTFSRAKGK